jgi:hypothetical protein
MSNWRAISFAAMCLILAFAAGYFAWPSSTEVGVSATPAHLQDEQTSRQRQPAEDGELSFENKVVNLGIIKSAVQHRFEYLNRSQRPVRILEIKPSCSCTVSAPDKATLKPGEKGQITVRIPVRSDQIGKHRYTIDMRWQASIEQTTQLVLLVQSRPDVLVPEEIRIRCTTGEQAKAYFTVVDFREDPLEITRTSTTTPDLQVSLVEKPSSYLPGWRYRFETVWGPSRRPAGNFSESILLSTTDPGRKTIGVKVSLEQTHRIRIAPENLHLKAEPAQSGIYNGRIFINDTAGQSVEIDSITTTDGGLQCQLERQKTASRVINITANRQRMKNAGGPHKIHVLLTSPVKEERSVTVFLGSGFHSASPR